MNVLIIILFIIGGLTVLLLLAALFVKKNYAIEREIVINRPRQEVFNYIKQLKNHDNFNKWMQLDPAMKRSSSGSDGRVGFVSAWESDHKQVGKGEQEIKKIKEGERIDYEIRFKKPIEGLADSYLTTESLSGDQTKVKWGFNSKMKYPLNIMMLFMNFEKALGDDLTIGLSNLKNTLENNTSPRKEEKIISEIEL